MHTVPTAPSLPTRSVRSARSRLKLARGRKKGTRAQQANPICLASPRCSSPLQARLPCKLPCFHRRTAPKRSNTRQNHRVHLPPERNTAANQWSSGRVKKPALKNYPTLWHVGCMCLALRGGECCRVVCSGMLLPPGRTKSSRIAAYSTQPPNHKPQLRLNPSSLKPQTPNPAWCQ